MPHLIDGSDYYQMVCYFIRFEVEIAEKMLLKIDGTFKIQADVLFLERIAIAITFKNIEKTIGEGHNLVMAHPLVGVEHYFFSTEDPALIQISVKLVQHHMLGNDFSYLRETEINAHLPADFRVMAAGLDAEGFGDVVEQGGGYSFRTVRWWGRAFSGSAQAVDQRSGYSGDKNGMGADIVQHCKLVEVTEAFGG